MSYKNFSSTKVIAAVKQALVVMAITAVTLTSFNLALAQGGGGGTLINPGDAPTAISNATGGQGSFRQLAQTFLNFILGFLGFLAVVMVIYGGFLYVTAAGKQEKVDEGKKIIMYAIVGIVIILLSFAIVNTVLGGLGTGQDQ